MDPQALHEFRQQRTQDTDFHHLLFQKIHYSEGYAKLLRNHPYMGIYIPRLALHESLHAKIHDVPTPNGEDCRRAYETLLLREATDVIDVKNDSATKRLDFLIEMWEDSCPATVAVLKWQRDVIEKFYHRSANPTSTHQPNPPAP